MKARPLGINHVALEVGDLDEALEWYAQFLDFEVHEVSSGRRLRFRDPWGNQVEVVGYRDVQFTKTPSVLRALGTESLEKTDAAKAEIRERGLDG